ncbi:hypothetical protein [Streptomyces sp. NPDC054794]
MRQWRQLVIDTRGALSYKPAFQAAAEGRPTRLPGPMATTKTTRKLLADVAERAVLRYVEAFLGLLLATGTTGRVDPSTLQSAAIAAIPAGRAVVKGAVGTLLSRSGTASWLPARTDPTSSTIG